MKALDYLDKIMDTICLSVDDDGIVVRQLDPNYIESLENVDGIPFIYPSNTNIINNLVDTTDPKHPKVVAIPFNPTTESNIGPEISSHQGMREQMTAIYSYALYEAGVRLLHIIHNDSAVVDLGTDLQQFLANVKEGMNKNVRKIVNESSINKWKKLLTQKDKDVIVLTCKQVKTDGNNFSRNAKAYFPLMEEIMSTPNDKDGSILGVSLKSKEIALFQNIFRFLIDKAGDDFCYSVTSSDKQYSTYMSTMKLFLDIISRLDNVSTKLLSHLDMDGMLYRPNRKKLTLDEIDMVSNFKKEWDNIPTDSQLLTYSIKEEKKESEEIISNPYVTKPVVNQNTPVYGKPQTPPVKEQEKLEPEDIFNKKYGNQPNMGGSGNFYVIDKNVNNRPMSMVDAMNMRNMQMNMGYGMGIQPMGQPFGQPMGQPMNMGVPMGVQMNQPMGMYNNGMNMGGYQQPMHNNNVYYQQPNNGFGNGFGGMTQSSLGKSYY